MRIIKLNTNPTKYSSNAYFIRGDFNTISDKNTVVDTGADSYILNHINSIYTGVGKKPVDQVVLTHSHFDHTGGVGEIKSKYSPDVLSYNLECFTTRKLNDNETIKMGDSEFIVMHIPFHSNDSICLYNYEKKILFSGDTPLFIFSDGGTYTYDYLEFLLRIIRLGVNEIYPGHGPVYTDNVEKLILNTINIVQQNLVTA
jgi:glyoxylase-like metal-dependent hydrolase (beta-lactamase superfamily II)